ncbi:universal stress protein [Alteromonas oceanisediminis]|uniref:universal stress protein n=1 Tax=Alteromonas oceanisediminis TaxID=2836180 RepID=UPI001BDB276E|nr:universal stress protein [Alteromonas oceanisediminis]MBT0585121.1 universal stress protein [Alteromonas oceanisediminis]
MSKFNHILCVMTELQDPEELLNYAISVCRHHDAKLTVMLSLEPLPPNANMVMESFSYVDTFSSMQEAAKERLESLAEQFRDRYTFDTVLKMGRVSLEVAKAVKEVDADLVLKKAKTDFLDRLFGSEDMRLLSKCPVPVWMTHSGDSKQFRKVVAAVDVNYHYPPEELKVRKQLNECVVVQAAQIAVQEGAELHIVHVLDDHIDMVIYDGIVDLGAGAYTDESPDSSKEREQAVKQLIEPIRSANPDDVIDKLRIKTTVKSGSPRREIPVLVKDIDADLLVMGTVARVGIPGFLMGNTAETILSQVNCSVLALKPQGFVSPIIT